MIPELELIAGIVVISVLAFLAVKLHALDVLGALSGSFISFIVFLAGTFSWFLIIVIFVGISSMLTRYKYEYKRSLGFAQEKMGVRSWPNSVANGAVSAIASIGEIYTHSEIFGVMFLTSVASAMSDTLATEIGLLSHSLPRLITNPRKAVDPGTSGGITMLGTLAALSTSIGMAFVGIAFFVIKPSGLASTSFAWVSVVIGSMCGVFFDSFLGGTVQGAYRCAVCGKVTENSLHHGQPTVFVKGVRHFDNNLVNFAGILVGSLISVGVYLLLSVSF